MKIVKWIVLGVVGLVVIVALVVYFNLNGIVRSTVESQGTQQLNVSTTLSGASVSLFGGSLGLDDLEIASPPGFEAPKILTLDGASVEVSYGQLRQDPIHMQQVQIKGPKLVIEQAGGKLNFRELMDRASQTGDKPATGGKREPGEPMHLIIDHLAISNAAVVIRPGIPGVAQQIDIPLPAINMEQVGTGEGNRNGAALKEVVMEVIATMTAKAAESDKVPPELKALLSGNLKEMASQLADQGVKKLTAELEKKIPGQAGKMLEGVLNNPGQATSNPSGAIEQGLGQLLGGEKKAKKKGATKP